MSDLTADQAELLEEIEGDEPSDDAVRALEKCVDKFSYVATLLAALAEHLREEGDSTGSALLLAASQEMAEHEARFCIADGADQ